MPTRDPETAHLVLASTRKARAEQDRDGWLYSPAVSRVNDLEFVHDTLDRLQDGGIVAWVFGGWAEELLGLAPQRAHRDLDLLYLATDFGRLDAFLALDSQVTEIAGKRFLHKRAFLHDHIMVEATLVQPGPSGGFFTLFWGDTQHEWPADVFGTEINGIRVASTSSLRDYRTNHARLRWSPDRASRTPSA
jgi:hypothetical protein